MTVVGVVLAVATAAAAAAAATTAAAAVDVPGIVGRLLRLLFCTVIAPENRLLDAVVAEAVAVSLSIARFCC